MLTNMYAFWSCIRVLTSSRFIDRSMAVPLFQFFCVGASVVWYDEFILSLFVAYLVFFLCQGMAVIRDCNISYLFTISQTLLY